MDVIVAQTGSRVFLFSLSERFYSATIVPDIKYRSNIKCMAAETDAGYKTSCSLASRRIEKIKWATEQVRPIYICMERMKVRLYSQDRNDSWQYTFLSVSFSRKNAHWSCITRRYPQWLGVSVSGISRSQVFVFMSYLCRKYSYYLLTRAEYRNNWSPAANEIELHCTWRNLSIYICVFE